MSTDAPYPEVPEPVLDQMVDLLFQDSNPYGFKSILYPGCGKGETIDAVQRYCTQKSTYEMPKGYAFEKNEELLEEAKERFSEDPVEFYQQDFLSNLSELPVAEFDFILSNPPTVPWEALSAEKRADYAQRFTTITEGQTTVPSDLMFLEQALGLLGTDGELVFLMPETDIVAENGEFLNRQLGTHNITGVETLDPDTEFPEAAIPHVIVGFSNSSVREAAPLPFDAIEHEAKLPEIFEITASDLMTSPVDTIPYETAAATAYIDLIKNDYDATVVVDSAGTPRGYLSRAMLHTRTEGTAGEVAAEFTSDVLLAPETSVETMLSRLNKNRFQFIGTPENIRGILTRFNLNEMRLYLHLFTKIAKLEYGLRAAIREVDEWESQTETTISSTAKRHLVQDQLSLATLGELIDIAEDTGATPNPELDCELDDIDDLRNDVSHYNPLVYTMASESSGQHERTVIQLHQQYEFLDACITLLDTEE
jgi:hypothetical protein